MNCRFPFSLSVNVSSIVRRIMAQFMQGGNSTVTEMRIFVANFVIFQSSGLAGNTSTVFLENIIFSRRITTRMTKITSHNRTNIRKAPILYSKFNTINIAFDTANPQIKMCVTKTRSDVKISLCFV